MSMNLMYSPLETIFEATMIREGRTMTAYTSGNQFQAFMRRNCYAYLNHTFHPHFPEKNHRIPH